MIIQLLFTPMIALINLITACVPAIPAFQWTFGNIISFVRLGMWFTDAQLFSTIVATFVFIEGALFIWNIIKFIYSKIPILNIR